jgi:uncharacterized protein YgbK (DUF1537 family)
MRLFKILKKPLTTEKTANLEVSNNTYVFEVDAGATKIDIKKATSEIYGVDSVIDKINELKKNSYQYAIIDTIKNEDFDIICNSVKDLPLLTGGAGIALGLPQIYKDRGYLSGSNFKIPENNSSAVIMSGSCSNATLEQINIYKENNPSFYLDPDNIMNNQNLLETVFDWIKENETGSPLVYSSSKSKIVTEKQSQYGKEILADKIEVFFEKLSKKLVEDNFGRFISAKISLPY